jgi:hypothetical protein
MVCKLALLQGRFVVRRRAPGRRLNVHDIEAATFRRYAVEANKVPERGLNRAGLAGGLFALARYLAGCNYIVVLREVPTWA